MTLRPELMPPELDETIVQRLTLLASRLDGAEPGTWDEDLAEFHRITGLTYAIEQFQGICGQEEHETWARRLLVRQHIRPVPDVTRSELEEIVRRAMPGARDVDRETYMAIFEMNVPLSRASNLIFYPYDYDARSNTWNNGRAMNEYDPSPEEIVNWALAPGYSGDKK